MVRAKLRIVCIRVCIRVCISVFLVAAPLSGAAGDTFASLTNIAGKVLIAKDSGIVTAKPGAGLFLDESIIVLRGAGVKIKFANGCSVDVTGNQRITVADAASCCGFLQDNQGRRNADVCHNPRRPQSSAGGGAGDMLAAVQPGMYQALAALTGGVVVTGTASGRNSSNSAAANAPDNSSAAITDTSDQVTETAEVKVPAASTAPPKPEVFRPLLPASKAEAYEGFSVLENSTTESIWGDPLPNPSALSGC